MLLNGRIEGPVRWRPVQRTAPTRRPAWRQSGRKLAPLTNLPSLRHGLTRMTTPRFAVTGNNHISLQIGEAV